MKKLAIATATAATLLAPAALAEEFDMNAAVDKITLFSKSFDGRLIVEQIDLHTFQLPSNSTCRAIAEAAEENAISATTVCTYRGQVVGRFHFD